MANKYDFALWELPEKKLKAQDTVGIMKTRTDYFVERTKGVRYPSEELYELANIVINRSDTEFIMGHHGVLYKMYEVTRPFFSTPSSDLHVLSDSTPWLSNLEHPISVKLTSGVSLEILQRRLREVLPMKLVEFYK